MLRVWQISLERYHDQVNALGWDAACKAYPAVKAYLDSSVYGSERWDRSYFEHYVPVAKLATDDLDDAFRIGNIGPQEDIREGFLDHSVSVGDILETERGELFMVNSIGFERVYA